MVTTNSAEYAKRMRLFRSHGITKDPENLGRPCAGPWDCDMLELGYNYRLSDIASVLGSSQMKRLGHFVAHRRSIASMYRNLLSGVDGIVLPPGHEGHSYHIFPVFVAPSVRKSVFERLRASEIGVQVHYNPVHLHAYYRREYGFHEGMFPNAERFSSGEITLPLFADMTEEMVYRVVDEVKKTLKTLPAC